LLLLVDLEKALLDHVVLLCGHEAIESRLVVRLLSDQAAAQDRREFPEIVTRKTRDHSEDLPPVLCLGIANKRVKLLPRNVGHKARQWVICLAEVSRPNRLKKFLRAERSDKKRVNKPLSIECADDCDLKIPGH
jgi:hypothetical protein